jgi:hypothetical protein
MANIEQTNKIFDVVEGLQTLYPVRSQGKGIQDIAPFLELEELDIKGNATTDYITDPINVALYRDCGLAVLMTGNDTVVAPGGGIEVTVEGTPVVNPVDTIEWTSTALGTDTLTGEADKAVFNLDLKNQGSIRVKIARVSQNTTPNTLFNANIKGVFKQ